MLISLSDSVFYISIHFIIYVLFQNNIDKFAQLKNAFEQVGFKDEEVNSIYCILAAILHLGDIEFGEIITDNNTDNKSTVIDLTPIHRSNYIF